MASAENWLDRGQQERDNLNAVLDASPVSVDVYRRPAQAGVAGLTARTEEPQLLRTVVVRLDMYHSRGSAADRIKDTRLGLTTDTDVRVDDLWRWTDPSNNTRWYRVVSVLRSQSASSVVLEGVRR